MIKKYDPKLYEDKGIFIDSYSSFEMKLARNIIAEKLKESDWRVFVLNDPAIEIETTPLQYPNASGLNIEFSVMFGKYGEIPAILIYRYDNGVAKSKYVIFDQDDKVLIKEALDFLKNTAQIAKARIDAYLSSSGGF